MGSRIMKIFLHQKSDSHDTQYRIELWDQGSLLKQGRHTILK